MSSKWKRFVWFIQYILKRIEYKFDVENHLPGRNIQDIMLNAVDAKNIDNAMEELRRGKSSKKCVKLTDNEIITISLG